VQSGNWSGPVGSTRAQQPFREGLTVREQQSTMWGFTPHFGRIEVELSATIGPRSMFSAWMVGLELQPDDCGEICVVEVFGDTVRDGQAGLGCGSRRSRTRASSRSSPPILARWTSANRTGTRWTGSPAGWSSSSTASTSGPPSRRRTTRCS
jgi:hypothetical protein